MLIIALAALGIALALIKSGLSGTSIPLLQKRIPPKKSERRKEDRLPFVARGKCSDLTRRVREGLPFETCVIDLSRSGCQILSDVEIPQSALVSLQFRGDSPTEQVAFVAYSSALGKLYRAGLSFVPQRRSFSSATTF